MAPQVALAETEFDAQTPSQGPYVQELVTYAPTAVVALDARGHITVFNPQAEAVLGYSQHQVLGKTVHFLFRDPNEARAIGQLLQQAPNGQIVHETFVQTFQGQLLPIRLFGSLLYDAHKNVIGSVGYFQDLRAQQERAQRLENLNRISAALQAAESLETLWHIVLTAVTADFGLRFHRAAWFSYDADSNGFVGRAAIGPLEQKDALVECETGSSNGRDTLNSYLALLEQGAMPTTPLAEKIRGLILPVQPEDENLVARAVHATRALYATPQDLDALPDGLRDAFQPAPPLVFVPLIARGNLLGILIADNKFNSQVLDAQERLLLEVFCNTAAVAIANLQLSIEKEQAERQLQALLRASSTLTSDQPAPQVRDEILAQACHATKAQWVSFVLLDENQSPETFPFYHVNPPFKPQGRIRPNGLSSRVLRENKPLAINDCQISNETLNPSMVANGVRAAICFPIRIRGKPVGVIWIHYAEPRHWTQNEIETLEFFVNHAALAYQAAQHFEKLETMRRVAKRLASVMTLEELFAVTAESAQELFAVQTIQLETTLADGRKVVENTLAATDAPPDDNGLKISLRVGEEQLGILTCPSVNPSALTDQDLELWQSFADQVALARKKVDSADRMQRTIDTANAISRVIVNRDLETTLRLFVRKLRHLLRCDAVTLYMYDAEKGEVLSRPFLSGVRYPERTRQSHQISSTSPIGLMLKYDQTRIVEQVRDDPLFQASRFVRDEGIESCMALPLRVRGKNRYEYYRVGVLFVNYRTPHQFMPAERQRVEFFANQAAAAIWKAQLFDRAQKQSQELAETHAMVGRHTAIEWMKMVGNTWTHEITGKTGSALWFVKRIGDALAQGEMDTLRHYLAALKRELEDMRAVPIYVPVTDQDQHIPFALNQILEQHFTLFWENEKYRQTQLHLDLQPQLDARVRVTASPQWIMRALDMLVLNAMRAMEEASSPDRRIKISTAQKQERVEILIQDSGPGFPANTNVAEIGRRPFPKREGSRGSGIGLMIVKTIAQVNGGDLFAVESNANGTTLGVWLPYQSTETRQLIS